VQGFFKTEVVENLRRNRPLSSLQDKCREVVVESLRETSQVGERENESCGETLLHFEDFIRKNGQTKSFEEVSRSFVGRWISRRCEEVTV
jgi:hypothetical protein